MGGWGRGGSVLGRLERGAPSAASPTSQTEEKWWWRRRSGGGGTVDGKAAEDEHGRSPNLLTPPRRSVANACHSLHGAGLSSSAAAISRCMRRNAMPRPCLRAAAASLASYCSQGITPGGRREAGGKVGRGARGGRRENIQKK